MNKKIELGIPFIVYIILVSIFIIHPISKFGNFVYMLDDAYIHLAFSENIANLGKPSVDSFSLSNPSSSPFWTIILISLYKLLNIGKEFQYVPLILNVIFSLT